MNSPVPRCGMRASKSLVFGCRYIPAHQFQHVVAAVLQSNIQIVAHIVAFTHHRQNIEGEMCRIGVMQSYPFHSFYVRQTLCQFGQFRLFVQIVAIVGQILRDELKLFSHPDLPAICLRPQSLRWDATDACP